MKRFGVKEVMDVTLYNYITGEPELYLDTLKLSNLEVASEQVYANGGRSNPRLVGWDFGRTTVFNIQDALLNPKAIAMQSGTDLEKKIETIHARKVLPVVENAGVFEVTIPQTPIEGKTFIYKTDNGVEQGDKVTATITGEVATLTGVTAENKQVIVYFQYNTTEQAEVITVSSEQFGGYYKVVGDTVWRNEQTGADELVQLVIPKAKIISTFNLNMSPEGDPSVFDFSLDVFKETGKTDMLHIVRYTEE